jgi:surfeit locus 1 family protein
VTAAAVRSPLSRPGFWAFVVLMLALTALFVGLGVWQVQRLAWKEGLIADVEARFTAAPYVLPAPDQWALTDLDALNFHPVTVNGTYEPDRTVLVFTSLSEPKGKFGGPGYWVMVPLDVGGGTVFVNRGFVPQANAGAFAQGGTVPAGPQTITGIGVAPEPAGAFTPGPDAAHHVEWVRDPARLAAMAGVSGPVLALTIDAPAGAPGELPQGGETTIEFPNNHFGYALTWFGFALLTPSLLAGWVWRQFRPRAERHPSNT